MKHFKKSLTTFEEILCKFRAGKKRVNFSKTYPLLSKLWRKFLGNLEGYWKILMKYLKKFKEKSKQFKKNTS